MLSGGLVLAATTIDAGLTVAAESAPTGIDPISQLIPYLNLGVIVILVIMAVTKKGFIPKWVLDDTNAAHDKVVTELKEAHARELAQEKERADATEKREEEYKRLNQDLQNYQRDQLQPALIETTRVVSAYVQALARKGDV